MKSLLVINSSAAREGSVSRTLVEETVERLREANPFVNVVRRDLGQHPVPHLSIDTLNGVRGTPATLAEQEARKLSDELIAELRAADTIVIGAPMYNFGVTTGLRGWFDYVLRAGETFSYSASTCSRVGCAGISMPKRRRHSRALSTPFGFSDFMTCRSILRR